MCAVRSVSVQSSMSQRDLLSSASYLGQQRQSSKSRSSSVTSRLSSKTARLAPGPGLGHCNGAAMGVGRPFGWAQWRKRLQLAVGHWEVIGLTIACNKGKERQETKNDHRRLTATVSAGCPHTSDPAVNKSRAINLGLCFAVTSRPILHVSPCDVILEVSIPLLVMLCCSLMLPLCYACKPFSPSDSASRSPSFFLS